MVVKTSDHVPLLGMCMYQEVPTRTLTPQSWSRGKLCHAQNTYLNMEILLAIAI